MSDLHLRDLRTSESAPDARRGRLAALVAIKVAISVGLLAVLFRWVDVPAMLLQFSDIDWRWLLLATALHLLQNGFSALKWQLILTADGQRVRLFFLFKTYQIANFLSLFMPTSFGGDLYRIWALNRIGVKVSRSTASVLFDRLSGLFALLSISVVGGAVMLEGRHAVALLLIFGAIIVGFLVSTAEGVIARLPTVSSRYLGFPLRVLRSFATYRKERRVFTSALALSACFQFNVVLIVACYARSLQIGPGEVSFLEMIAVVPIIFLSEVLPSINGIGVRDGAFVLLFTLVGTTAEKAMAVSLMVLAMRYVQAFLLAAIWIGEVFDKPNEPHPESRPAPERA